MSEFYLKSDREAHINGCVDLKRKSRNFTRQKNVKSKIVQNTLQTATILARSSEFGYCGVFSRGQLVNHYLQL